MNVVGVLVVVLTILVVVTGMVVSAGVRVVAQYERGVVFRLGRVRSVREPGLRLLIPAVDKMRKISMQVITMPVPAQEGITRDNVTVRVDAVVYFRVVDPMRAIVEVQDYLFAVAQVAQTSLRSIIGKSELDDLLSNREQLNKGLEIMIDSPALAWGVHIDRVEIKDVALPDALKRSMSRQAEAERERRARIISAEGEFQASQKLADAATNMAKALGRIAAAIPRDRGAGCGGEEFDAGAAVPGRTAAVLRPRRESAGRHHRRAAGSRAARSARARGGGSADGAAGHPGLREALAAPERPGAQAKTNAAGQCGGRQGVGVARAPGPRAFGG